MLTGYSWWREESRGRAASIPARRGAGERLGLQMGQESAQELSCTNIRSYDSTICHSKQCTGFATN